MSSAGETREWPENGGPCCTERTLITNVNKARPH